ncbi:MAG: TIGR03620 family F420-dependent LLM class oxidoreductase [Actinomycetota bacterium]|nr:TIGR03620 family F420-dependent LLM class oxidoreductase [Actinomycetota bacterium]
MQIPSFALPRLGLWTASLDFVPLARACELAAGIEQLGYGALWVPEVAGRDVFVGLGALLRSTERLIGATGIASIWARDAVTMTGGAKALTEAFPERVLLGLGVSHHSLVEGLRGHTYRRPLEAMRSYLDAMDASPYSGFRPGTPVRRVLAALGPRMLDLAAERTEGAHTYLVTPEHTAFARERLGAEAEPASRRLLCVEQAVLAEADPSTAREVARGHTSVYVGLPNYQANLRRLGFEEKDLAGGGSDRLVDAIVAWGDEETIARRVREHFDAGADHVCVQPLEAERRSVPSQQWELLAPALLEASAG